jgi:hypothetical protein
LVCEWATCLGCGERFALLGNQTGEIQTDKFQVSSGQVDRYSENDMKKNITVIILSAMLLALCGSAEAQQATNIPRIGVLRNDTPALFAGRNEALRQGLRELGYVEGKNIVFEYRMQTGNSIFFRN